MAKNKVSAEVREFFSKMGKRSAMLRMKRTTQTQRSDIARQAATKRWAQREVNNEQA